MRRVVVTGMGIVSPLGLGVNHVWQQLIAGKSGIDTIKGFDSSFLPSTIAGEVPLGSKHEGKFNVEEWMSLSESKRIEKFIILALVAATEAVTESGIADLPEEVKNNIGVSIGSGIGGLQRVYSTSLQLAAGEYRKISPFFIPSALINLASGHVSIKYGLRGPNMSIVTACSTGAHSIGDSFWMIRNNVADIMLAGGAESSIFNLGVAGFTRMNALSTNFNNTPSKASRPWDKARDGFVMAEGAGVLVLEELEHAKKRGAEIYAEVVGFGMSGDANHITAPAEDGIGASLCMQRALKNGNVNPEDINYINAHGTSTPLGDEIEVKAIKRTFNDHSYKLKVSSTKSSTGHLLGAAGAVEAIFSIKAMQDSILPPTLNLDNPSEGCDLDFVPHQAKEAKVNYALSNSFGFGGTNAALVFKKF